MTVSIYISFVLLLTASGQKPDKQPFTENEIIVKPVKVKIINDGRKKVALVTKSFIKKHSLYIRSISQFKTSDLFIIKTKNNCNNEDLVKELKNDPNIIDASLNYIASVENNKETSSQNTPDDPAFQFQYGLNNTGILFNHDNSDTAKSGSDIKALSGWWWATGDSDVIIAVIDTGVAIDHEDLKNKIIGGYNFVSDNNNPYDDHGHGTMVASIAAAETNNGIGMAGVAWNCLIMPVKVMDNEGNGSYLQIAAGIRYAADNGAKVINLSVGGINPSFILEDACKYAFEKGSVIIAASGNINSSVYYPAAYDDYCLAVGASDYKDELAAFSNYGPSIDIVAPGVAVFGAVYIPAEPDKLNGYGWDSGTSFSTPYVSGAVAILLSYKPFLTTNMVMDLLRMTADDVNIDTYPGTDDYMGYGRLNINRLLSPYELKE